MVRYYFDVTDDEGVFPDDTGIEYGTLEQAKVEAARALAEMARDRVPGPERLIFIIAVRDERKNLLFEVRLTIEVLHVAAPIVH
jgi:hypothetical protein